MNFKNGKMIKRVTSLEIAQWAEQIESKNILPLLIRKLVLAGIPMKDILEMEFPSGEDIQTGGYDGIMEVKVGNFKIPEGKSVWEFGIRKDKKAKADKDYEKRKTNPLGKTPSDNTYIGVTAYKWRSKKKWQKAREKENFWKDVRYYDAEDLESWLDAAPSVAIWLARLLGKPINGVFSADEYWSDWATYQNHIIPPQLLIGNRTNEVQKLIQSLQETPSIIRVKSYTQEEALAFILASLNPNIDKENESYQVKTLVVNNVESFQQLIETDEPLIMVPLFNEEAVAINRALRKGHHVIIPSSITSKSSNGINIELPIINYDIFLEGLETMGIDTEQARLLSKNTGRNVAVLRRTLGYIQKPAWVQSPNIINLIPFMLIARFHRDFLGDREVITKLSGQSFETYEKYLQQLLPSREAPLLQIGSVWRLFSHTDTWLHLAQYITTDHFQLFQEIALEILAEHDQKFDLKPEQRTSFLLPQKPSKYSNSLKQGIAETLVIIALFAKKYGASSSFNNVSFVNEIVAQLLSNADKKLMRSLRNNLPLLAEAAPEIFLEQIDKIIEDKRINAFFEVEEGFLYASNDLHYLLWSLEKIAWMPEHVTQVVLILAKLDTIGPSEYPTSDKPFNSLASIFKVWYPQTNATLNQRIQVLQALQKAYPDVAFKLYNTSVKNRSDYAWPTQKMRWRLFQQTRSIRIPRSKILGMLDFMIDQMMTLTSNNASKAVILIGKLSDINPYKWNDLLIHVQNIEVKSESDRSIIYHAFRELIGRHRKFSSAKWALPETTLEEAEKVAQKFIPKDMVLLHNYLFDDTHPELMEGIDRDLGHKELQKLYGEKRQNYLYNILQTNGLGKIIELGLKSKNTFLYGETLGKIGLNESQEKTLFELLASDKDNERLLVGYYILERDLKIGRKATLDQFEEMLASKEYIPQALGNYLLSLWDDLELWKYIESLNNPDIENHYWFNHKAWITANAEAMQYAIHKFLNLGRSITVLNVLRNISRAKLPVEFILDTMEQINLAEVQEPSAIRIDPYSITHVFEDLYQQDGLDTYRMAMLESKYLFAFDKTGQGLLPKFLFDAVAVYPNLFVDLIKTVYKPTTDEQIKLEQQVAKKTTEEAKQLAWRNAYFVLDNFNRIPGMDEEKNINYTVLSHWVEEVRRIANEIARIDVTEDHIGVLFAKYPKQEETWFPDEVCDVLEQYNSTWMKAGFSRQIFNGQGATWRSANAGGDIEREKADFFNSLFEYRKITHPNVAKIFKKLAQGYQQDGDDQDLNALGRNLEY